MKKLALAGGALAVLAAGTVAHAKVVDKPKFKVGGLVLVWGGTTADANAPVVSDFYLLSGTDSAGADLIGGTANDVNGGAGSTVVTGAFDLITDEVNGGVLDQSSGTDAGLLDAGDTLSAFTIDENTDLSADFAGVAEGKFFIASNTGFQLKAQASVVGAAPAGMGLDNILFDIEADGTTGTGNGVAWGSASQLPCATATDCAKPVALERLSQLATDTTVITADRKTAATRGSIADQSVRFDTTYKFDADSSTTAQEGYDLSDGVFDLEAEVVYTVYSL